MSGHMPKSGNPWGGWEDPARRARKVAEARNIWGVVGVVVAVVLALAGLAVVGVIVLFFVGMSNYGSNK